MDDDREKSAKIGMAYEDDEGSKRQVFGVSENFGLLLKHHRTLQNLTLKELEEISGVSSSYINRIERSERNSPSITKCFQLCDALEIPYYSLLTTAFSEAAKAQEEASMTLPELLISNDFCINQAPISKERKWFLIQVIEYLLNCSWGNQKVEELFELSKMIDEFKKAV
ncbi:helix-turn-helix domain-containing protein [Paenibacillus sp. TAF58]